MEPHSTCVALQAESLDGAARASGDYSDRDRGVGRCFRAIRLWRCWEFSPVDHCSLEVISHQNSSHWSALTPKSSQQSCTRNERQAALRLYTRWIQFASTPGLTVNRSYSA